MTGVAAAAFAAAAAAAAAYAVKLAVDGVKAAIEDEAAQLRLANALNRMEFFHRPTSLCGTYGGTTRTTKQLDNFV